MSVIAINRHSLASLPRAVADPSWQSLLDDVGASGSDCAIEPAAQCHCKLTCQSLRKLSSRAAAHWTCVVLRHESCALPETALHELSTQFTGFVARDQVCRRVCRPSAWPCFHGFGGAVTARIDRSLMTCASRAEFDLRVQMRPRSPRRISVAIGDAQVQALLGVVTAGALAFALLRNYLHYLTTFLCANKSPQWCMGAKSLALLVKHLDSCGGGGGDVQQVKKEDVLRLAPCHQQSSARRR